MEKIELTAACVSDAQAILDITKQAFERYAAEVRKRESIEALFETLEDVQQDISSKMVFTCKIDEELVGCVRLEQLPEQIAYLTRFAIKDDAQNLGLGGLLLEKVRLVCIDLGVRAIALHTASRMRSSVAFYLKNGYYIHSISQDHDYIRALMINELTQMDELYDYESIVNRMKK